MTTLNGWTAEKLYDLKQKVDETHHKVVAIEGGLADVTRTLKRMESEETQSLRDQVRELHEKPQRQIATFVIPFVCACIPAAVLLLSHA